MALFKLQHPREFKLETYYYNQDEENADPKRRIRFRRIRHYKKASKTSPLRFLLIALVLLFFVFYLQKKAGLREFGSESGALQVEEIIIVDE